MKPKIVAVMAFLALALAVALVAHAQRGVPKYEPDPFWPKPLPNKWMMGQIGGTADPSIRRRA